MKLLKRPPFLAVLVLIFAFAFGSISASAKDVWLNVKSQNFNLYGNASEKEIKKAATKLEQFRETFRQLFANVKLESSVPTNVVVFKSNSYYKEFKPKRADGKTDDFVAGFFQPGEDVNYITLSMDGSDEQIFKVVFHEYVHSILNAEFSRITIPPWFNEGLAEYYSTFEIRGDRVVSLGLPLQGHLQMLRETDLIPLETLFSISGYGLLQMQERPRSLFYAESWALVHYLTQSGKTDGLGSFLAALGNGADAKAAFEKAFQMDYKQMEKELRKYARGGSFKYHTASFKNKLTFDESMVVTPIDEGEANAYLGDLLYHNNRAADAEPYLAKALAIHPDSPVANTAMGMVRFRAGKYDEAGGYLEKVVSENSNSHFTCYLYALVLTKTASDGSRSVPEDVAKKAVGLIKRSIALNPKFFPSYDLLAFTALSTGVGRDDAVTAISSGLKLRPNDPMLLLRLAELYVRTGRTAEAGQIAAKVESLSDDPRIKSNAASVKQYADAMASNQQRNDAGPDFVGPVVGTANQYELSPEELKEQNEILPSIRMNKQLAPLKDGMKRVVGYIGNITCPDGSVHYAIKADGDTFTLTSKDFQGLELMVYGGNVATEVGCDADLSLSKAVLTYIASTEKSARSRGELISIDFVPDFFRLMSPDELAAVNDKAEKEEEAAKAEMLQRFPSTRKLQPGEKRVLGVLETMECSQGIPVFRLKTADRTLRLALSTGGPFRMVSKMNLQAYPSPACGMAPWKYKVVALYTDAANKIPKTDGTITVIELVSDDFTLNAPQ